MNAQMPIIRASVLDAAALYSNLHLFVLPLLAQIRRGSLAEEAYVIVSCQFNRISKIAPKYAI